MDLSLKISTLQHVSHNFNTYKLGQPLGGPSQKEMALLSKTQSKSEIIWVF